MEALETTEKIELEELPENLQQDALYKKIDEAVQENKKISLDL